MTGAAIAIPTVLALTACKDLEPINFPPGLLRASQPLVGADGRVHIGAPNGNFYAVNPNGTLRWKCKAVGSIYVHDMGRFKSGTHCALDASFARSAVISPSA